MKDRAWTEGPFQTHVFPVCLSRNNAGNPDGDCTSANQSRHSVRREHCCVYFKKIHLVCTRKRIKTAQTDWIPFLGISLFLVTTHSLTWPGTWICSHMIEESNAVGLELGGGGEELREEWKGCGWGGGLKRGWRAWFCLNLTTATLRWSESERNGVWRWCSSAAAFRPGLHVFRPRTVKNFCCQSCDSCSGWMMTI